MNSYAYSQTHYPRKVTDSTVEITNDQVKTVNKIYLSLQECRDINQILTAVVDSCKVVMQLYNSTDSNLKQQISILNQSIKERDTVITTAQNIDKEQRKEIKRLKRLNRIYAIVGGVITAIIVTISIL